MHDIDWKDNPPAESRPAPYELRRVGLDPTTGFATGDTPLGVMVHFYKGRTRPCVGTQACEACENGNEARWKGYLTLFDPRSREHWIQEYTAQAHEGIKLGIVAHGSLRGHEICFRRQRRKPNSPMIAEVWIKTIDLRTLPSAPDVKAILRKIWDIPEPEEPDPPTTEEPNATHERNGHAKENVNQDRHPPEPARHRRQR